MSKLAESILCAHREAVARSDDGYIDPDTGFFVMTEEFLRARGECCGSRCRHCPYSEEERRAAGRPIDVT